MISVAKEWNPRQNTLKEIILKPEKYEEAIRLCLDMHSLVHASEMGNYGSVTYEDELWKGLEEEVFRVIQKNKGATIAWNLWHITRIEDITANILIADDDQVLNNNWLIKLNTAVRDTGNAMTNEEIEDFSLKVNMKELRSYRITVGKKTQKIIRRLEPKDLIKKMRLDQLKRIIDEGGVLEVEGSKWLVDFWGKKTVAGILLMPITRHQIVHLNAALKIKKKYRKEDYLIKPD